MELSVLEVAARLSVCRETVLRLVYSGQLPARNYGTALRKILRVQETDLAEFVARAGHSLTSGELEVLDSQRKLASAVTGLANGIESLAGKEPVEQITETDLLADKFSTEQAAAPKPTQASSILDLLA